MSTTPEILRRTFVHAPGIGASTEKALWSGGITSWDRFLANSSELPVPVRSLPSVLSFIERSAIALSKGDAGFFAKHLSRDEWWRLFSNFESRAVFLDIETTGLSHYYDEITLVGLYDGIRSKTLLAGYNLKQLASALEPYDIVVTFNGTLFDIPFLKTKFPHLKLPQIHLDLRFLLRRLGYSGGLKQVEQSLGIRRKADTQGVDGLMATVLWARYLRGDIRALEQLVKYNAADITSLQSLLQYTCQQLSKRLLNGHYPRNHTIPIRQPRTIPVAVRLTNGAGFSLKIDRETFSLRIPKPERPLVTVGNLLKRMPHGKIPKVVGIDLRGSEIRPTGWALLQGDTAQTCLVKTDDEIIEETIKHRPDIISIDSPLGLPMGRCCSRDSCKCRSKGILRQCERTLWRRGVRVFPCLLPSMQMLTMRGIRLAKAFRRRGYKVIESYPGAAQDIMRIPRKKSSLDDLSGGLAAFGIKGDFLSKKVTHDELDAITSAVVGYFYLTGDYEALGNDFEEFLIIPKLDQLCSKSVS